MLNIAVSRDDERIFFPLTNDPTAEPLADPSQFEIEEIDGIVAERIKRDESRAPAYRVYEWRRLVKSDAPLKVLDLTGPENDDWIKTVRGK